MINMKKTILTALTTIIICLIPIAILPATAQYTCGLQAGKYAKYKWSMKGSVIGQSYSESGTVHVNIQSVTGTSYSGNATFTVTGGNLPSDVLSVPQGAQNFSGDVAAGYGSTGFIDLLAIPANVTIISSIPGAGNVKQIGSWKGRSAVIVNSSMVSLGLGDTYYDQNTGILLYSKTTIDFMGLYSFEYKVEMTNTNLWSGGLGSNTWMWEVIIVIIVVVAAVAVTVAVILRRKKQPAAPKQTPQQQPPPPPPPPAATT
jgi:flagellar basal body-associated protein FliL